MLWRTFKFYREHLYAYEALRKKAMQWGDVPCPDGPAVNAWFTELVGWNPVKPFEHGDFSLLTKPLPDLRDPPCTCSSEAWPACSSGVQR